VEKTHTRQPTVVVPFDLECRSEHCNDIFIYLRPETNGIEVESVMMRTLSRSAKYHDRVRLVYLANLPGDFIDAHHIIEEHYRLKLAFTKQGKKLFTPYMQREFSRYFQVPFEEARILGGYEAMKQLRYTREQLFRLWVPQRDIFHINGQTIKKTGDIYIINYDIPAILRKNSRATDIAAMVLRTSLPFGEMAEMITDITDALRTEGILDEQEAFSRVFHYSKGPFEQILDAIGFLYRSNGSHIPIDTVNFYRFLRGKGLSDYEIRQILHYPIMSFSNYRKPYYEETIYAATYGCDYESAYQILCKARGQVILQ
jgi:hypothetical protein